MIKYGKALCASGTAIPGLLVWDLPVNSHYRGRLKENWQREKMVAAGLVRQYAPVGFTVRPRMRFRV